MPLPQPLRGIVTPLLTPLLDTDTVDVAGLERLIEHVIAGGVHGIFLLGTSGEGPSLSLRLQREVITRGCAQVRRRVPVLAAVTNSSIVEALALSEHAAKAGADAVVNAGPLYMPVTQEQLVSYLRRFARQSPLPVYLYNMPSHTRVFFQIDTVRRAAELPAIVGLKDSSGEIMYMHQVRRATVGRAGFSVLVGPEEMMAECVLLGIDGGVNGGSNLFPSLYVSLYDAASRGDLPKVRELQSRVLDVSQRIYSAVTYASGYLQGIKCAASLLGLCSGELGPPYEPLAESLRESIRSHLVALGALRAG